ncbi:phage tail tube protein [Streptomyces sp. enrichment culture]|uniref:phage tail tube protein n=1 Tax=Streptomyces sp. enrichment culture TaxID=1795815 RepID=UPI003F557816
MALQKYNARDVVFEIEDVATPNTWIEIGGINTFSKSHEEETADTTTFASEGQAESQKMQVGKQLEIEGFRLRDTVGGTLDPGQAMVETLSERLGEASLGKVRFAHKDDTSWEVWTAHVNLGDQGGGNNDKTSWSATFTRSGANTTAAKV